MRNIGLEAPESFQRPVGAPEIPARLLRAVEVPPGSAELKGPQKLFRIRPEIFDFEPDLVLKPGQTKPKIPGTVPTNRHTPMPNDSGPISACFDDDPKLLNCKIAQPNGTGAELAPNTRFSY